MARLRLWVGLDVGADSTTVCAIDNDGALIFEDTVATNASDLHQLLRMHKRRINLVGLESGSCGTHLTRSLRKLGYEVAVFDARQVNKFLGIRQNKTDRNDARGLAEVARLGREAVSEIHLKSHECQRIRTALATRQKLLRLRIAVEGMIRSQVRLNGGRLKSSWSAATLRRHVVEELARLRKDEKIDLRTDIEPLLALAESMRNYLKFMDNQLRTNAEGNVICQRFLEIPGVGPICALSFYSAIEDPGRFRRNADVGAYLGMVPRVRQSGQNTMRMRISKMGNTMTRSHLATAAFQHLRYGEGDLQQWGVNLVERIGKPRARMAVARKLAVTMIAMWKSDEPYISKRSTAPLNSIAGKIPIAA